MSDTANITRSRRLRERAHVVCVECHARKVKCDLQQATDNVCTNCRRVQHDCVQRTGTRKRRSTVRRGTPTAAARSPDETIDYNECELTFVSLPKENETEEATHITPQEPAAAFFSASTVMSYDVHSKTPHQHTSPSQSSTTTDSILHLTQAHKLLRPALLEALIDSYFQNVYPFYPLVDRSELSGPTVSILLQQAVCLAASVMQHGAKNIEISHVLYEKVKTLIHVNFESNKLHVLRAMCLATSYSAIPTDQVTFDGPWHWLGMAIRLHVQMGLYKQSTYAQFSDPGLLRRIFWHLVHSDRLAASCWGRPLSIRLADCDVPPLTTDDFPTSSIHALAFIHSTRLSQVMGSVAEINNRQQSISEDEARNLVGILCDWQRELPDELRLYETNGSRRAFNRPLLDMHITYFVSVILLQLLEKDGGKWRICGPSFVAASCIARIYEDIHYRQESARLVQIHGFFCMVAAVAILCYPPGSVERDKVREEELDILRGILQEMSIRYGGAELVLRKINRLQQDMRRSNRGSRHSSNPLRDILPTAHVAEVTRAMQSRVRELLPYPVTSCNHMDILDIVPNYTTTESTAAENLEYVSEDLDLFFFGSDLNLTDLMAMDYQFLDLNAAV